MRVGRLKHALATLLEGPPILGQALGRNTCLGYAGTCRHLWRRAGLAALCGPPVRIARGALPVSSFHPTRPFWLAGLAATVLCGFFFIGMQVYEFTHFVHKGLTLQRNMFGASLFTLTGFHGTHVTIGVIWLITMFILALRGQLTPERSLKLEMAALYWHFVDVVWIIIFPVVYLIK